MSLALVASMLLLTVIARPGHAASGPRAAHQLNGANVFVQPQVSSTLWFATLDPALATGANDIVAMQKIDAGLVKLVYDDATGTYHVAPDLAAGPPTVTRGGLVYTFRLRPDARFSDGQRVTAQDVVYSINRALSPAEKSPVASFYLGDILGASAVASGKAKACQGLTALSTDTVRITLNRPVAYFLFELTYPTSFVLEQNVPVGAPLTTEPSRIVGAGPFVIKNHAWQYRSLVTLAPNPYYYNARNIKVREIDLPFVGSTDAAFAAYRSGQFPMAQLPAAEVPRYRGTPEFRETHALSTAYIAMNVAMPPFDNRHLRRAVAFAINRDALANGALHGTVAPLYSWYPKGLMGYDAAIAREVPHYDLARARGEMALALKEIKHLPGDIALWYVIGYANNTAFVERVQSDLRAIGLTVTLHPAPYPAWAAAGSAHKMPLFLDGWLADYPDPQDFSEVIWGTGGGYNYGAYSNPTVDALFARADVEQDPQARERLYRQAQRIILNDAPLAMAIQIASQDVISTKYHGVELTPTWGELVQPVKSDWAKVTVSP